MSNVFEVTYEDIERLSDEQLTSLLLRLLRLEASAFNIPTSSVSGTLEISVGDGGEDARIKWESSVPSTNWFPKRYTLFQCKATPLGPLACRNEICIIDAQIIKLKPRVEEVLDSGGSYILFFNTTCSATMEHERITAFREGIRACGKAYADSADIKIYDSNKIAAWVNQYIPAIIEVCEYVGRYISDGVQTWFQWSKYKENVFNYEMDNFLKSHITQLRAYFIESKRVARIVGLSGLGKTRLALEAFRPPQYPQDDNEQFIKSAQVVYIDASNIQPGLPGQLAMWRSQNLRGIVVVDNCDIELHKQLVREVEHRDSLLSLLTLDFTPERLQANYPIIELRPASDEVIRKLIGQAYPGLPNGDVNRIVEFAQGFPRMAVLVADARLNEENNIGNLEDDVLVHKLLWGRGQEERDSLKIISACAIFEHIGFYEEMSEQRKFIAEKVCKVDEDTFYEIAQKFIDKGILDKRGRFVRVTPRPLAIRLAADWWRNCSPDRAKQLVLENMPDGMSEALCDQMSKLHFLREAQELTKELCGERAPFGQAEVLNSEKGSRLFRSLVEVNPLDTVNALRYAFGNSSKEELMEVGPGRRNLIWALEKLCFWEDTFVDAARLLLAFAVAENETWGNNATNQLMQLFHVFLSGTQAAPCKRFEVIDYALGKETIEYKIIAVKALGKVIETGHFTRMTGVEIQGSRPAQLEWQPKTWEQVFSYWRKGLDYLTRISIGDDNLAILAREEIADGIRGLVQYGLMDELETSIKTISDKINKFWPKALESVEDAIKYEGVEIPEEGQKRLIEWLEFLKPDSFEDRLKLVVSIPSWNNVKEENGSYIDTGEIEATNFALECSNEISQLYEHMEVVLSGEQRKGYIFGYTIGQHIEEYETFINKCLCKLEEVSEPNTIILAGFLSAIKVNNQTIVSRTINRIAENDKLISHLIDITRLLKPEKEDLERVLHLVDQEKINIKHLRSFMYGSVLSHLSIETVIWFSDSIIKYNIEGCLIALDILFMYCHNDKNKFEKCIDQFITIVKMNEIISHLYSYSNMDDYHWQHTVLMLLNREERNVEFARDIAKNIVEACANKTYEYSLNRILTQVISVLLVHYRDDAWDIFSSALLSENHILEYRISSLFKAETNLEDGYSNSVLHLPNEVLIDWCNNNSQKAPHVLCNVIPVIIKEEDALVFHPVIQDLIDKYGDREDVLRSVYRNMGPSSWTGSIIPYYEQQICVLNTLLLHSNSKVRNWAERIIWHLKESIEKERQREEEHDIGVY